MLSILFGNSIATEKVEQKAAEKVEEKEAKTLLKGAAAERVIKALQKVEEKKRKRAARKAEVYFPRLLFNYIFQVYYLTIFSTFII